MSVLHLCCVHQKRTVFIFSRKTPSKAPKAQLRSSTNFNSIMLAIVCIRTVSISAFFRRKIMPTRFTSTITSDPHMLHEQEILVQFTPQLSRMGYSTAKRRMTIKVRQHLTYGSCCVEPVIKTIKILQIKTHCKSKVYLSKRTNIRNKCIVMKYKRYT